jgi:hypothetical protein
VGGEYVGGIDSIPNLGAWEQESDEPSLESILVRPKLYSHHFPDVVDKSGSSEPCYKQAKHGFAKFHTPKVDAALRDMTLARQARIKIAEAVRASELHEAMRAVHTAGSYSYETRAAPLKLRTAIRSGRTPGRFESRPMKLMATGDPNNYLGEDGFIHWGAPPRQAKEAG